MDPRLMPGCPIGRLCIGRRGPPETTRLRNMLGGGDQLGDEISPRQLLVFHRRPTNRRYLRDQRDARRLSVRNDAVICRLLWSIAGHGNSKSRLNCHISGHCARCDVLLASGMPPLADWFLAGAQRGFRNVYELEPRSAPKQTVFLRSGITGSVLKRGDRDVCSSAAAGYCATRRSSASSGCSITACWSWYWENSHPRRTCSLRISAAGLQSMILASVTLRSATCASSAVTS